MKRLILMVALLVGLVLNVNAQKVPTAQELAKKNIDEMEERLKLSSTQKSVLYNIAYDMAKEQLALYKKQQAGTYVDEDGTIFFKKQNESNNTIRRLLKPEQVEEFNKLIEDRLNGVDSKKKKKKLKKGEVEEKVTGIEGLKSVGTN
ncbi:MAG: hypothetical protein EOO47_16980 [Flavobacterium sp.]|nr:MAG: hypothetical protein EOO47_16980 [Flavobacterium sp.]